MPSQSVHATNQPLFSPQDLPPGSFQDGPFKAATERVTRDLSSRAPRGLSLRMSQDPQAQLNVGARLRPRQRRRRLLIKKMPAAAALPANSSAGTLARPAPGALDGRWARLRERKTSRSPRRSAPDYAGAQAGRSQCACAAPEAFRRYYWAPLREREDDQVGAVRVSG